MTAGWASQEAAQADYETLRAAVLADTPAVGLAARRFAAGGLVVLIARPVATPVLVAVVVGARRPPWCGDGDPRLDALAAGYGLVLATTAVDDGAEEVRA
ncbi:MAG: hypothetical protein ACRDYF_19135 [Acidimicrobiia bacterium]